MKCTNGGVLFKKEIWIKMEYQQFYKRLKNAHYLSIWVEISICMEMWEPRN